MAINLPLSLVVHDFLKDSNDISFKWLEKRRNEAIHYMIPKNQEENKVLLRKLQFLNNSNINKLTNNELIILSRSLEEIITHDKADIVIFKDKRSLHENINTLKISSHFIERLAKNLKRENNKISFMAIVTLKKIGKRAKVSIPLLKEFINHSNPLFRHQALEAIWNIIDNKDKLKKGAVSILRKKSLKKWAPSL